jgi:hypothetical protein
MTKEDANLKRRLSDGADAFEAALLDAKHVAKTHDLDFDPAAAKRLSEDVARCLGLHDVDKAYDPDEARDAAGKWTAGESEAISNHVARLKANYGNNHEFDRAIEALHADKSMQTKHVSEIARQVLGREPNSRGRGDTIKEMAKWQFLDARRAARAAIINGMN